MECSILCSLLNMCSKCFVGLCQTVLLAVASTGSPTASPKSSSKRASSRRPESGQRLAGKADNAELIPLSLLTGHSVHLRRLLGSNPDLARSGLRDLTFHYAKLAGRGDLHSPVGACHWFEGGALRR